MNKNDRNYIEYILNFYSNCISNSEGGRPLSYNEYNETDGTSLLDDVVDLIEKMRR